ncbi:hypothetical protein U9M48_044978, partial [Paspalum notatum var. saurae]
MKDPEAWRWICNHWTGSDFQGASDRNRGNRTSKLGMQRFGADGFIGKEQRMEAKTGAKPSFVEVYIEGHKGSDPDNPEVLCDEQATEKLAKYKENVIQRHGPEFDWNTLKPYMKLAVGYAMAENNDYMMTYLMTLSQKLGGDVLEFRPPQPYQQAVPPNYFVSSPMTQGPPLGDAPEFRPPPNYYSTPTSQGSPRGDAQGSQPPNQIIPSGQGSGSRAPSQNPDDVDAFLNQSGGAG